MRYTRIAAVLTLCWLSGCGSRTSTPTSQTANIKIAATQTSISTNQTTTLTATYNDTIGDYYPTGAVWYITETHNSGGNDCTFDIGHQADANPGECPAGVLTYNKSNGVIGDPKGETATYYPPATAGTYHVTYGVEFQDYYDSTLKQYVSGEIAIQVTVPTT